MFLRGRVSGMASGEVYSGDGGLEDWESPSPGSQQRNSHSIANFLI